MLLDDLPDEVTVKLFASDPALEALWCEGADIEITWAAMPQTFDALRNRAEEDIIIEALSGPDEVEIHVCASGYVGCWVVELTVNVPDRQPVA